MPQPEQSLANHSRFHPLFHFILIPIFVVNVLFAILKVTRSPDLQTVWNLVVSVALVFLALVMRVYALKVQDRVIRLEERSRLRQLLPSELQSRIPQLTEGQLVAMRFCADEDLEHLTRSVLDEKLLDRKQIKSRITTWRPDHFRV